MKQMIDTLRQIVLEELLGTPNDILRDDDELLISGRIDSLGIVRLTAVLEETFQVDIPPEDVIIENFETLQAIAQYLEQQLAVR
jgi:acyl carrier protein